MMHALQVHLAYASVVWLVAWLVSSLPAVSATTKYWLWVATAVNFALPLSLIPAKWWPSPVSWFTPGVEIPAVATAGWFVALWIAGAMVMAVRLSLRIRRSDGEHAGPAVVGLLKTRIALPNAIDRVLDPRELHAVVAHERRHAQRHDNLIRLLYELSLCALWFHPLVWLTGARLALYRELSCDEAVDDERDLISALAKLASPENEVLLQATASSFISDRLIYLQQRTRASAFIDRCLAAVFSVVLLAAMVSPIAQSIAAYLCALTHGAAR